MMPKLESFWKPMALAKSFWKPMGLPLLEKMKLRVPDYPADEQDLQRVNPWAGESVT